MRQPIGPVAVITPWNTPFMLSTWKIAPALAAGCTVVHKPAEWSPLTAMLLAEICVEAGLPAGVLNLVNGIGEEAGKALTEHPAIKAVAFVGSTKVAKLLYARGTALGKRMLCLGGAKNHLLVVPDADPELTATTVVASAYGCAGQRCMAASVSMPSLSRPAPRRTVSLRNWVPTGRLLTAVARPPWPMTGRPVAVSTV